MASPLSTSVSFTSIDVEANTKQEYIQQTSSGSQFVYKESYSRNSTIKSLHEAGIEALASGRKFSLRLHLKTVVSRKVVSYILRGQCNKVTIIYFNIKPLKSTLSGTNDQNPLFDDVISRSKQFAMSPLTFCKKTHCSRKKTEKLSFFSGTCV